MRKRNPGKRGKFLNYDQIGESIETVAALAKDQHVHVALAGGAAMQIYGSDRFTKDVDFLASDELQDLEIKKALSFGGFQSVTPGGVTIDLIIRDDQYKDLYESALETAEEVEGLPIRVATIEYMVAMKLAAGRGKDMEDLAFLLLDTDIDYPVARTVVVEELGIYAGDELDSFLEECKWQRSRGKR